MKIKYIMYYVQDYIAMLFIPLYVRVDIYSHVESTNMTTSLHLVP
jgi:hypothetical protein